jgi:hypothetical protein
MVREQLLSGVGDWTELLTDLCALIGHPTAFSLKTHTNSVKRYI